MILNFSLKVPRYILRVLVWSERGENCYYLARLTFYTFYINLDDIKLMMPEEDAIDIERLYHRLWSEMSPSSDWLIGHNTES